MKMKPIKFVEANAKKIDLILNAVNGRASDHTYCKFSDFESDAESIILRAEKLLGGKKYSVGAKAVIESGGSVPNAYKYSRVGTRISLECRASGWFITDICRTTLWAKGGDNRIIMTTAHHERAIEVLKRGYFVTKER
jgi:hypothetical protein